ncbi:hypothetical protein CASFOL_021996 [Castilleja foliolosa]|uniref:CCHC-type domain-containing protein n=1 Tax=Castilleja foliolosa TaxID=1961234 RepID=A0ABD3CZQ9_9LAMI
MADPNHNPDTLLFTNIQIEEPQKILPPNKPENNESTIIAKILTTKSINLNAFKSTITKAWNVAGRVNTNLLQENTMAFIFNEKKDQERVLNSSWSFRDHQVIVAEWPKEKALTEIDLSKTRFWIHVVGIPVAWIDQEMAENIGNFVGSFVKADLGSPAHKWRKSLRIQVEIDISEALTTAMLIGTNGRKKILLEIRYERLTDICYKCGKIGHKSATCPDNMECSDESTPTPYPKYGPWMKAENSHIQHPRYQVTIPHTQRQVMDDDGMCSIREENPAITTIGDGEGTGVVAASGTLGKADETAAGKLTESSDKMEICQKIALGAGSNGRDEAIEDRAKSNDPMVKDVTRVPTDKPSANLNGVNTEIGPLGPFGPNKSARAPSFKMGLPENQPNKDCKMVKGIKRKEMEQSLSKQDWIPTRVEKDVNLSLNNTGKFDAETKALNLNPNFQLLKKIKIEQSTRPYSKCQDRKEEGDYEEQGKFSESNIGIKPGDERRQHTYSINRFILKESRADVVFLCEVKTSFSWQIENALNTFSLKNHSFVPPIGSAGGVILAWKDDIILSANVLQQSHIHCTITHPSKKIWKFTAAYVPCNHMKKALFWDSMSNLNNQDDLPWLIMGDMNAIVSQEEKIGGLPFSSSSSHHLSNDLNNLGLIDLGFVGYPFTWDNKRVGINNIQQRLDRGVGSSDWITLFPQAEIHHLTPISSDHAPILLITAPDEKIPIPFKFENMWTDDPSCYDTVHSSWKKKAFGSPSYRLITKIKQVKSDLKLWNHSHFGNCHSMTTELKNQLNCIQAKAKTDINVATEKKIQMELDTWLQRAEIFWRQKAKDRWLKEGEANTSDMVCRISKKVNLYWLSMVKSAQTRSSSNHKWRAPPAGWIKINVDSTFVLDYAFSGVVVRNDSGTITAAKTNNHACLDATSAECLALLDACYLIRDSKIDNVIFESDCLNAISFINGEPKNSCWTASPIVDQIKRIWSGWPTWIFNFSPRESNGAAHELAKWAKLNDFVGLLPLDVIPINVFCDQGFPIVNNIVLP